MTYCVGIKVNGGLVFCSDSRTNSGIDQGGLSKKLFTFHQPGACIYYLLVSGNLATTQAVVSRIESDLAMADTQSLFTMNSIRNAADYIGQLSLAEQGKAGSSSMFQASFILGGQISGQSPDLVMIYPEGNAIAATELMPFLQIGESKYGKPILDRIIKLDTNLETCALCALVSMDSTLKSNLSVGPPIDLAIYHSGALQPGEAYHLPEDSAYLREIHDSWNQKMIDSFLQLPPLSSVVN